MNTEQQVKFQEWLVNNMRLQSVQANFIVQHVENYFCPEPSSWISCEDRLPENEKDQDFVRVIVTVFDLVRKPLTMFAIYHNENFYGAEMWWSDGADSPTMTNSVTHWQPLPAAPLVNNLKK